MDVVLQQQQGLGNQLFQYAAAVYYGRRYGGSVQVIRSQDDAGGFRPCVLDKFHISATVRDPIPWDRLRMCPSVKRPNPLSAAARRLSRTLYFDERAEDIWKFFPTLPVQPETRTLYLRGFFQSFLYAQAVESQLRSELHLHHEPGPANRETLDRIRSVDSAVSVHIRRGDYKHQKGASYALPLSYTLNAIAEIQARIPNPTFFIFSDEIAFAREHLPPTARVVFVDHNDQKHATEDLRLMAACRHHIIANSSFSWWGAWLNPSPGKIVLAPSRWLSPTTPPDLLPRTWQIIPADGPEA